MKTFLLFALFHLVLMSYSQPNKDTVKNVEIPLERDSLRSFFGTYEFAPQFRMNIFSVNGKVFAQRDGDNAKFQIFPKRSNAFFLNAMSAELEFKKSGKGSYDTLLLHQGGKDMKAHRISSQPYELYDTILHLDSLLYKAYNARDLKAFLTFFSPELEFYHDLTGRTNYKDNLEKFKTNFSSSTTMRRELLKGSLEVYAIKDFGAIEVGTHNFYQTDEGQSERLVAQPKFIHVWKKTTNGWKIVRVVSYDH
jgi:ketosteroid isomerase-like protein